MRRRARQWQRRWLSCFWSRTLPLDRPHLYLRLLPRPGHVARRIQEPLERVSPLFAHTFSGLPRGPCQRSPFSLKNRRAPASRGHGRWSGHGLLPGAL
jgi:hypothetical protein